MSMKCIVWIVAWLSSVTVAVAAESRPNVILVMTDDQGWAEVGFHGNTVLKTPNLDRFAAEGTELTNFYVSPMCTPTRSSLMTGRYHFRTGAHDTYIGRSNMNPEETTIAEVFADAGYRTGIFGKWHLGIKAFKKSSFTAVAASGNLPTSVATRIGIRRCITTTLLKKPKATARISSSTNPFNS